MPIIKNKEYLEYGSEYSLTKKAKKALIDSIELSKEDVYDNNYNLYNITKHLIKLIPNKSIRENCNIETTLEIMRAIEYLKNNDMI